MAAIAADRNLLFGLLALQNGLINQGQLVAAFQAWSLDKGRSLADHLEVRRDLNAAQRAAIEALAALHIEKHGGDTEKSLAAIPAGRSARASLARIGDPDIGGTLVHVGSDSTRARRRPRSHRHPFRRHGHQRRPAVPRRAPSCTGRPGGRLRGARQRIAPRSRPEADPRPPRGRPRQPAAVPARGGGHRRAGAPRHRARIWAGDVRRRPAVLCDAAHPGRYAQGGHRAIPWRRGAQE